VTSDAGEREEAPGRRPKRSAKDRALGLLAVRWRSRRELEQRLRAAGFEPEEVARALADLDRAGLVDDKRFARELTRSRANRLDGNRSVRSALAKAGVSPELAEASLAETGDESERAFELARRRAAHLAHLEPDAARRRLYGLLVRRGYLPGLAAAACREALEHDGQAAED
jgi:regulatory protein